MVCGVGFRWWVGLVLEGYFRPGEGSGGGCGKKKVRGVLWGWACGSLGWLGTGRLL